MSICRENAEQSWKQDLDPRSSSDFTAQTLLLYLLESFSAVHCFGNTCTWVWLFWTLSSNTFPPSFSRGFPYTCQSHCFGFLQEETSLKPHLTQTKVYLCPFLISFTLATSQGRTTDVKVTFRLGEGEMIREIHPKNSSLPAWHSFRAGKWKEPSDFFLTFDSGWEGSTKDSL